MYSEIVYEDYFWGVEYDWIAFDENNHVGLFSTAGFGFVPKAYCDNHALFEYDYYENILSMDPTCLAIQVNGFESVVGIDSVPSEWVITATRGIYAFDWCHELKKYQLIAKPEIPLTIDSIDEYMKLFIEKVQLDCNFETGKGMDKLIDHERSGIKKFSHKKGDKLTKHIT